MTSNDSPQNNVSFVLENLKAIAASVMRAAEGASLQQVLERIAQVSRQLVRARYAALGVPDGEGRLKFFETVGMDAEQISLIDHPPIGLGLLGAIMNERHTLRLPVMQDDPRSVGFPPHHPSMTRLLGVPILAGQQLFGMLYLCDREDGQPFDESDQMLVEMLAGYAALAIAGVHLGEQQGRLLVLEDRERIGMELHDGTIQSLYAIGLQLQLLRADHSPVSDQIGLAIQHLDEVIEDIRRYILNLKVSGYAQRTVSDVLQEVVARARIPAQIKVDVDAPSQLPPFTPPVFEAVCQVVYEALSNVVRHAEAEQVEIKATQNERVFQLTIQDDGQGFDPVNFTNQDGLGLRNMQQRAHIHGGSVDIQTTPGEGTRLTITIPVKPIQYAS